METFIVPLFVLLAIAAGLSFVWGAPIFGVPLLMLALAAGGVAMFAAKVKRSGGIHNELENAKAHKVEFTDRDKQTLSKPPQP
jgi:Na+/H+ antiporter NhaD/arsenite permease-like protein